MKKINHMNMSKKKPKICRVTVALLAVGLAFNAGANVTLTKIGEYDIQVNGCGGITYLGGDRYYVVRDHNDSSPAVAELYPLTITSNPSTGAISSFAFGAPISLIGNGDTEGVAYDPSSGYIWVSDEGTPSIKEYLPSMGSALRSLTVPNVQRTHKRSNKSLEALSMSGDGLVLWTCNEEALSCDGDASSPSVKTVVRLTKYTRSDVNSDFELAGQWPYKCETCGSSLASSYEQTGASGLCALPDGSLLVLEREVSTTTWGRCEIYRVTPEAFAAATEVSSVSALTNFSYTAVNKGSSLISFKGGGMSSIIIYEGICLGPRLSDGSLAVYLISDGGVSKSISIFTATTVSRLCALKLQGLDVHTLNFTPPTSGTASIVGSNYRYLKDATVNVSLDGVQTQPSAYTNNNAMLTDVTWTANGQSPASGSGAIASFAVAGDGTFAWAWSQSMAVSSTTASDSFEAYAVGTPGGEIPGWSGEDAEVVATNYSLAAGFPMDRETHTKVLSVDGDVTRAYPEVITNACQKLDMAIAVRRASEDGMPEPSADDKLMIACDQNGYLCIYCKTGVNATNWVQLSSTAYANDTWVRVELTLDHASNGDGRAFAQVKIDGVECATPSGYASPTDLTAGGSWYELLTVGAKRCVSSLTASGTCKLDDLILTVEPMSAEPEFIDGVPVAWLDAMGMGRDPGVKLSADSYPTLASYGYALGDVFVSGIDLTKDEPFKLIGIELVDVAGSAGKHIRLTFNGVRNDKPLSDVYQVFYQETLGGEKTQVQGTAEAGDGQTIWTSATPVSAEKGFYHVKAIP